MVFDHQNCLYCKSKFINKDFLDAHIKDVHICDKCGFKVKNRITPEMLNEHYLIRHSEAERNLINAKIVTVNEAFNERIQDAPDEEGYYGCK